MCIRDRSKTFGLSGLRLGWAAFRSRDEAAEAARFVETTTSGVSTLSQLYAEQFLEALKNRKDSYKLALAAAKRTLEMNSDAFRDMLCHVAEVEGAPAGHGGMFAWFRSIHIPQVFLGAAAEAKVNVVDGSCMGAPGWFRLSMGLSAAKTREALSRISEVLGG
jgi:aspartate/methionine/tyrosine aminotransferase